MKMTTVDNRKLSAEPPAGRMSTQPEHAQSQFHTAPLGIYGTEKFISLLFNVAFL
jgi:hypothetical protein